MKQKLEPRCVIQENAERITQLHDRIGDALDRAEWSRACEEFHSQYDALAFPGGYRAGLQKIQTGDANAIENALAFLEVRPYFFRSQYMRTKLTRLLKHAQLTARQTERFQRVLETEKKRKQGRETPSLHFRSSDHLSRSKGILPEFLRCKIFARANQFD